MVAFGAQDWEDMVDKAAMPNYRLVYQNTKALIYAKHSCRKCHGTGHLGVVNKSIAIPCNCLRVTK